jgi:hypothetical protein
MTDIDVDQFSGIVQNHIVTMKFTQPIDPVTVKPASIQVRQQNATNTGYSIDVPGSFQVAGAIVRFYPRLPTHLRDPKQADGSFYQPGTPQDDATNNAGFQPLENYQITIIGNPHSEALQSTKGRSLNKNYQARFTTSARCRRRPRSRSTTTATRRLPGSSSRTRPTRSRTPSTSTRATAARRTCRARSTSRSSATRSRSRPRRCARRATSR